MWILIVSLIGELVLCSASCVAGEYAYRMPLTWAGAPLSDEASQEAPSWGMPGLLQRGFKSGGLVQEIAAEPLTLHPPLAGGRWLRGSEPTTDSLNSVSSSVMLDDARYSRSPKGRIGGGRSGKMPSAFEHFLVDVRKDLFSVFYPRGEEKNKFDRGYSLILELPRMQFDLEEGVSRPLDVPSLF